MLVWLMVTICHVIKVSGLKKNFIIFTSIYPHTSWKCIRCWRKTEVGPGKIVISLLEMWMKWWIDPEPRGLLFHWDAVLEAGSWFSIILYDTALKVNLQEEDLQPLLFISLGLV